jgi:hypothetical protein
MAKSKVKIMLICFLGCKGIVHRFGEKIDHGPGTPRLLTRSRCVCDFFLFSTMRSHLKGSHFKTVEEIQKVTTAILNNLQENSCGIKVNNAQNNSTLPLWTNTHKL